MTEQSLDAMIDVLEVYKVPLRAHIISLLNIYGTMTTKELADKLHKAKTTVLRNIKPMVDLGIVEVTTNDNTPGKYPTQKYTLNKEQLVPIRGQDLRNVRGRSKKELQQMVLDLNATQQSFYLQLRNLMDSSVNYLQRLREEIKENIENAEEVMELLKDNLGTIRFQYMTKEQTNAFMKAGMRSDGTERPNLDPNGPREYLYVQVLLPVRRVLDMEHQNQWSKDGDLWFYDF